MPQHTYLNARIKSLKAKASSVISYAMLFVATSALSHHGEMTLSILTPPNYLDSSLIEAFESERHIKISVTNYHDESVRDRILDGGRSGAYYDILITTEKSALDYTNAKRFMPLPASLTVGSGASRGAKLQKYATLLSSTPYGVAYRKGSSAPIDHWKDFYHLPQEHNGRISIPDEYDVVMDTILMADNADFSSLRNKEINQAGRTLLRFIQRTDPKIGSINVVDMITAGSLDYALMTTTEFSGLAGKTDQFNFVFPGGKTRLVRHFSGILAESAHHAEASDFIARLLKVSNLDSGTPTAYINEDVHIVPNINTDPSMDMRKAYLFERVINAISG